uniref:Uncharacterized protein n=1 Tax=Amphimedon queenslandica TaxID=400682 RepID=A0A1X7UNU3_AMPQE
MEGASVCGTEGDLQLQWMTRVSISRSPSPDPARRERVEDAGDSILPPRRDPAVIPHGGAPTILPGEAPAAPP